MAEKILETYNLDAHGLSVNITIKDEGGFTPIYYILIPGLGDATKILLQSLRQELISMVPIDIMKIESKEYIGELTDRYSEASNILIDRYLPGTAKDSKKVIIAYVVNVMLGLGELEAPLADENLEEVVVNNSSENAWVYHKVYGWCRTNIRLQNENAIYNDAEQIGRRVGRQITNLSPLMDAELPDGSRVNATLYPISQKGNTLTIRKFGKNPWTMPAMIGNGTISPEIASLVWLCIENEISILISGGTASGKTSFLNAMSIFMPATRRIISVEETRELTLPDFLHWVPMLTRQPNPEGKGEIKLYDLMINALRQRPDIVLIGEVRTKPDAETLLEAIHTGHAVYGTVHADNAEDTIIRMTNPPIDTPKIMLNAFGSVVSLLRHRRLGIRRLLDFGEILNDGNVNSIYRWDVSTDTFVKNGDFKRLLDTIILYGGYSKNEIADELAKKSKILSWMVKNKIYDVNDAGLVVVNYYKNREKILELAEEDVKFSNDIL